MSGQALAARLQLERLSGRHHVLTSIPPPVELAAPTELPVTISGLISSSCIDHERMAFRNYSLGWYPKLPPLLFRHDPKRVVGTIRRLEYTPDGLAITATIDDPEAARCRCFSIGASIDSFTIVNADRPDFYALITRGWLNEVSLVPTGVNPQARVHSREIDLFARWKAATDRSHELLVHSFTVMQKITEQLARLQASARSEQPQRSAGPRGPVEHRTVTQPRRGPSDFQRLVAHMNRMECRS